jgi:serine/threonine protein kinase
MHGDQSTRRISKSQSKRSSGRKDRSEIAWTKGKVIGSGGFGTVYLGMDANTGQLIAGKEFNFDVKEQKQLTLLAQLEAEIRVMKDLLHENIVQYRGAERRDNYFYIFMEYVPGGSLRSLLDQFGPLQPRVAAKFTRQILHGLEFLHQQKVVHRDIKAANVLVNVDSVCKLADFGSSETFEEAKGMKGTPYWMAPEVITGTRKIGWQADIWSLGCMLVEMMTGSRPFAEFDNPMKALNFIANSTERVRIPETITTADRYAADFISMCLDRDPQHRPPASVLLTHIFISSHTNESGVFSSFGGSTSAATSYQAHEGSSFSFNTVFQEPQPDSPEEIAQQQMLRSALLKNVASSTQVMLDVPHLVRGTSPKSPTLAAKGLPHRSHADRCDDKITVRSPSVATLERPLPLPPPPPAAAATITTPMQAAQSSVGSLAVSSESQHLHSVKWSQGDSINTPVSVEDRPAEELLVPHVMESVVSSMRREMEAMKASQGRSPRAQGDQEEANGAVKGDDDDDGGDDDDADGDAMLNGGQSSDVKFASASANQPWTLFQAFRVAVALAMIGAFAGLVTILAQSW